MSKRIGVQIAFCGICYILMFWGCDSTESLRNTEAPRETVQKIEPKETNLVAKDWKLLHAKDDYGWLDSAVGRVEAGISCTATLVFKEPFSKHQNALALTAGHCIDALLSENWNGERILIDSPLNAEVSFHWLESHSKEDRIRIPTNRVVYGSMQPYDIALIELTKTYRELSEMGLKFIPMYERLPKFDQTLNVSLPITGTKKALRLHIDHCEVLDAVHVKEHLWNWPDSYAHSCQAEKGSSGSPMLQGLDSEELHITAIVNTKSQNLSDKDKDLECSMDHPCELNADSGEPCDKNWEPETYRNYGQPVAPLLTCLEDNNINFALEGCKLKNKDAIAPSIENLEFHKEEGIVHVSILTGDDKGKGAASMAEVLIHYDAFPQPLPIYFPIHQPNGLKYNAQTGIHELSVPVQSMAQSFGLSQEQSAGKLKIIIMDESLNKSQESEWIYF